jgi:alpha-glucosidase
MSTVPEPAALDAAAEWWRGAAIYQIYPRSFADSNGDGIGDLPGVLARLDHVASLGVDAVWLSPFFRSPMRDFGYDVADYCAVDPIFGTLADFDALVAKAHRLGLRVIIDQVYSHTSDQHDWFRESRSSRDNPKADWYVWADPRPDGTPPTNWQSVFGGPAWTWDGRRGQYYLHNFLSAQPDLNGHHPEVQDALLDVAEFWLRRGVDGFRLDALNFLMHDPALRDNPPAPDTGRRRTRPFDFQRHLHNQSHRDIPRFLERLRALTDRFGTRFTVAEVGGPDPDPEMKAFTAGANRLNSAYSFDFLYAERLTPALVRDAAERWPHAPGIGWPSWAFSNHDAPRCISRWVPADHRAAFAATAMLLLLTLRGNPILYQGEELGLTQVTIDFDELKDPEAIANWPLTLSRDGARTPMPWVADAPQHGFSSSRPWLPLGPDHGGLCVDRQERDPHSLLALTRRLIRLRSDWSALRTGDMRIVHADDAILCFDRIAGSERLRCLFNLTAAPAPFPIPAGPRLVALGAIDADRLGPFAAMVCRL